MRMNAQLWKRFREEGFYFFHSLADQTVFRAVGIVEPIPIVVVPANTVAPLPHDQVPFPGSIGYDLELDRMSYGAKVFVRER